MTKPALDSLLLHFCLVRTRYFLHTLSLFLFCHCSRTIDTIFTQLFLKQLLRIIALNVFLHKEKSVGWNTLVGIYIFHLLMMQATLKTMNKETQQLFKKLCCLPYCVSCFNSFITTIFISTLCQLITNKWHNNVISNKQYQMNLYSYVHALEWICTL